MTDSNTIIKKPPKIGYMCKTDSEWELGEADGGVTIYPSIEDIKEHRKCVVECGIVKVEIHLVEIVQDENYKWE